jgi:hypothetical protein
MRDSPVNQEDLTIDMLTSKEPNSARARALKEAADPNTFVSQYNSDEVEVELGASAMPVSHRGPIRSSSPSQKDFQDPSIENFK